MKHALGILLAASTIFGASAVHAQIGVNLLQDGSFAQAIGTNGWTANSYGGSTETITSSTLSAITAASGTPFSSSPFTGVDAPSGTSSAPATFALFNNGFQTTASTQGIEYLSQNFQTTVGTIYMLSLQYFAFGLTTAAGVNIETEISDFTNPGAFAGLYIKPQNVTPSTNFTSGLITETLYFTGNGDIFELDIADRTNFGASVLPIVTNVSVINVPEPMSLGLMGAGLLGLGVVRNRRRA
jgi:hypothetical protein